MRALGVLLVIVPTIAYSPQLARTQPGSKACSACPTRCAAPVANAVNKGLRLRQLENNLKVAISNEDYDTAAKLRDILAVLKMDTEAGAIAANDEFYRCFSKRNLACMERLWLNDESSVRLPLTARDVPPPSHPALAQGDLSVRPRPHPHHPPTPTPNLIPRSRKET